MKFMLKHSFCPQLDQIVVESHGFFCLFGSKERMQPKVFGGIQHFGIYVLWTFVLFGMRFLSTDHDSLKMT